MLSFLARKSAVAGACLVATMAGAQAADYVHEDFQAMLAEGRTTAAAEFAAGALETAPGDDRAEFARGTAQFLLAVEHLGQGLYHHGLKTVYDTAMVGAVAGMSDMPFLRLPVPPNPDPEPVTYEALRAVLDRFVQDLAVADATLEGVADVPFDFPLDLATIRLDFNGDGVGGEDEVFLLAVQAVSPRVASDSGFWVDFDQSDAPWLRGYTHLLSAMGEFLLAHDWEDAFAYSFHGLFPDTEFPGNDMNVETQRTVEKLMALVGPDAGYMDYPRQPAGEPQRPRRGGATWNEYQEKLRAWEESDAYQAYINSDVYKAYESELALYNEYSGLVQALEIGSIADLVAFLHLFSWPVDAPERMAAVRLHLLDMIALSRENWQRIRAEVDDGREWMPGPAQSGIFERLEVSDQTVENWHSFLDEFEAILNGERVIKHWRFTDRGINMRRMFEEPMRFDPWLIAQGSAVVPYLEEGSLVTGDTAETMLELFGGDFFAYFIWFN